MPTALDVPTFRSREEVRRYIEQRTTRTVDYEATSVRLWRQAGRATLIALLVYAALQYYFLHVFVEIMTLPALTTFIGS